MVSLSFAGAPAGFASSSSSGIAELRVSNLIVPAVTITGIAELRGGIYERDRPLACKEKVILQASLQGYRDLLEAGRIGAAQLLNRLSAASQRVRISAATFFATS